MIQGSSYTNYNGLQAAWIKTTGPLTFNLNGTWSKALGTSLQANPYVVGKNYRPDFDRPVHLSSTLPTPTRVGSCTSAVRLLNHLGGDWTVSGISTWQAGGYIPAALGNGVPNFSLGLTYATGLPGTAAAEHLTSGIGSPHILRH